MRRIRGCDGFGPPPSQKIVFFFFVCLNLNMKDPESIAGKSW